MPKTGTTAIQSFLFKNRKTLETYGISYPILDTLENNQNITSNDVPNIRPLFRSFFDLLIRVRQIVNLRLCPSNTITIKTKKWYKKQFTKLFAHKIGKSSAKTIILSEECLSDLYLDSRENFIDALLELQFNVKIIVYIRPVVERLTSHWCERMRPYSKLNKNLAEYLAEANDDYEHIFPLIEKLGKDNIIIKPFEKCQWKNNNFIEDFLNIFNLALSKDMKLPEKKVRVTPGRNTIELFQIITRLRLKNKQYWVDKSFTIDIEDVKVIETLTDEQILKTTMHHESSLRKLANIYNKESFFINKFPSCYGQERPLYDKISLSPKHYEVLCEALEQKVTEESLIVRAKIFLKKLQHYTLRFFRLSRIISG